MTNLNSVLKSRHVILLTKVHIVKAMVFPVVMYGNESCTSAFKLWYWRRLLRVQFIGEVKYLVSGHTIVKTVI